MCMSPCKWECLTPSCLGRLPLAGSLPYFNLSRQRAKSTTDWSAEDPKLAEFLQVMQPRHKSAIWANQDSALGDRQQAPTSAAHTASAVNKGSGNRKDPAPAGTATTQVALAQHQGKAQKKRKQQEQLIRQAGADEAGDHEGTAKLP